MNEHQIKIEIQNVHGRFAQYFTAKRYDRIPALFSRNASYVCPDDRVSCQGYDAVADYFEGIGRQECGKPSYMGMFPLMNNPIVQVVNSERAKGCWTSHCYIVQEGVDGPEIEYGIRRYDADFVLEDGCWKYEKLISFYFASMVPMAFDPAFEPGLLMTDEAQELPPERSGCTETADYLEILQLQSLFIQDKFRSGMELFARRDDISLNLPTILPQAAQGRENVEKALRQLLDLEKQNRGRCVLIPMIESPVIEVQPDGTAVGFWHTVSHEIKGEAFGHPESYCPMYTRIGRMKGRYIKEDGSWKLFALSQETLFTLPPFRYDREESRMLCMESPVNKWMDPAADTGFRIKGHEADMLELQELIALWSGSIRHRSFGKLVYEKVAWERPDLTDGKDLCRQIFGMTDSFYKDQPKYPGFHCGTTPYVQINEDKETAEVTWYDYGYTSVGEKFGYLAYPWYAKPGIGCYRINLVKCDDVWKIYAFSWKPFFRIEYQQTFWKFDYARSKGWVGNASTKRFPLPFQEYTYTEERYYPGMSGYALDPPEISCPREVQIGETIGFDVLEKYSGYTSNRPIPRSVPDKNTVLENDKTQEQHHWKLGMKQVADGVYAYITEGYTMMSNAALIVGEKYAMVFDALTSSKISRDFLEACRAVTDKPIRYLVYSHAHGDHFLGSNVFPDALKIAHSSTKAFFEAEAAKGYDRWEGKLFTWVDFAGSSVDYPDIFIDTDTTFDLGGREVQIKVTHDLHTAADLYAVVPDVNVVCCGDLLFSHVCPNGRPQGFFKWIDLLQELIEMDAAAYIPGHGPVSTKEDLANSRAFMKKVIQGYMKMCNGKTLDQAIDEIDWSFYAENWLEPGRCYSDTDRMYAAMTNSIPNIPISPGIEKPLNTKIRKKYGVIE